MQTLRKDGEVLAKQEKRINAFNFLMNDELSFYESFNNASKSLNKDLDSCDNRQYFLTSQDKLTNRYSGKNYKEDILEEMLADRSKKFSGTGGINSSNMHIQSSLSTNDMDNSRFDKSSCENSIYAEPQEPTLNQDKKKIEKRNLGRLMISYMFKNDELFITIQKAEIISQAKDHLLDTFVTIMILPDPRNKTKSSTSVVENSMDPEWNKTFVYGISLAATKNKYIYLSIKDYRMVCQLREFSEGLQQEALKHISLGEALLSLSDIRENIYYEMWCNLKEPTEIKSIIATKIF